MLISRTVIKVIFFSRIPDPLYGRHWVKQSPGKRVVVDGRPANDVGTRTLEKVRRLVSRRGVGGYRSTVARTRMRKIFIEFIGML